MCSSCRELLYVFEVPDACMLQEKWVCFSEVIFLVLSQANCSNSHHCSWKYSPSAGSKTMLGPELLLGHRANLA